MSTSPRKSRKPKAPVPGTGESLLIEVPAPGHYRVDPDGHVTQLWIVRNQGRREPRARTERPSHHAEEPVRAST